MYRAEAPGRVNLIGEHTDYNDGLVLPTATPQHTRVAVVVRDDDVVHARSEGFPEVSFRVGDERRSGDWGDHIAAVTWSLRSEGHALRGFEADVSSRVPVGAGLASSAALEVALLRALGEAFSLSLDDRAIARLAHRGEHDLVGARVGTMDQLAAVFARAGEALFIDMRSGAMERVPIDERLALVVVDSGIAHAHAAGEYNRRRAECEAAAKALGLPALRDATVNDATRLAVTAPALARRVRHVVGENERVRLFVAALRAGDAARCGALLDASHASLRDDFEVSLPELDALADALRAQGAVFGARLVGGGFGGAVLALASADRAAAAAHEAARAYSSRTGRAGRVLLPA